eukprot:640815-Amphidinium_carterae.1
MLWAQSPSGRDTHEQSPDGPLGSWHAMDRVLAVRADACHAVHAHGSNCTVTTVVAYTTKRQVHTKEQGVLNEFRFPIAEHIEEPPRFDPRPELGDVFLVNIMRRGRNNALVREVVQLEGSRSVGALRLHLKRKLHLNLHKIR